MSIRKKEVIEQHLEEIRHSPWAFFVNKWRLTLVMLIAIIAGGLIGLTSMPLESDPEIEIPIGVVTTVFPGASPADVEELVTDKLETELNTLDDLKLLTSTSSEGISSIVVEFEASADVTESIRTLRDQVSDTRPKLPEEAEDPIVSEVRSNDYPIITFSLIGNLTPAEFEEFGEDLQEELESIQGVSQVFLSGIQQKQMQVLIDIQALEGLSLSVGEVVQAIQANHVDFPIGSILTQDFFYQASLKGQLESEEDLLNLPIKSREGRNIFLKDIAEVREVFGERSTITKIYQTEDDTIRSSVNLQVFKKTGGNIIDIADTAKEVVEAFRKENLPPSMSVLVTGDNSSFVRQDVNTLGVSGLQVIFLIFILLFIALGLKEAVLAGMSIPFIFFVSFAILFLSGSSINFLVLFSLILAVGLIVDTAIIMMEGVHENLKDKKLGAHESALLAIYTYRKPLISSTLTTISAFIPMALIPGVVGQFMAFIPRTITITLIASLFVSLLLLPAVAARIFKNIDHGKLKPALIDRFMNPARSWYEKMIRSVLSSKRKRRSIVAGMILTSMIAISFPFVGIMKIQMWPKWDGDYFIVEIEGPLNSKLEDTFAIAEKMDPMIQSLPEVINYVTIAGGTGLGFTDEDFGASLGGSAPAHRASITINLVPNQEREYKAFEISEMLRKQVKSITEARIEVKDIQTGPPQGAGVEVRLIGDDLDDLETYSDVVARELKQVEGARDVDQDIRHGAGEFEFTLKRDQLEFYGLSASQLATELRSAVFGSDFIKIVKNGEETPIVVRLDFREEACKADPMTQLLEKRDDLTLCNLNPKNLDQIKRLLINTPKGQVPLSELVDASLGASITSIRHRDTDRIASVRAFESEGFLAEDIRQRLQERLINSPAPEGVRVEFGGEFQEAQENFNSLFTAMYVGLILITIILVLQFNSFRQPFIILFTLPLALIGVFFGLTLIGRNFSFPGFIGIVALMGIVVNDAIVLIDRINNNIRAGMKKLDAIVQSGKERLQPIFLTTVTTAIGILPLVWASSFWADLALAIFFGIIFATVLTLVMVPIFYNALESGKELEVIKDDE